MKEMKTTAQVLVDCLEAEGVDVMFGIPGEETLDLMFAIRDSKIRFIPVRHEQGAAFMADVYGRLTGRAGVCLSTLGPGATNLVTGVADAYLDGAPLVAITGQVGTDRMQLTSHQYLDLTAMFEPITKRSKQIIRPDTVGEIVRLAFKHAEKGKPGATHIDLPQNIAKMPADAVPLKRQQMHEVYADPTHIAAAGKIISEAKNPVILAGAGAVRSHAAAAVTELADRLHIPVVNTMMAKGIIPMDDKYSLWTIGIPQKDYVNQLFDRADVVIAIGYDIVECAPAKWGARENMTIVHIDSAPADVNKRYQPAVEVVGDISEIYVTSYKKMLSDKNFRPSELAAMASGYAKLLEQSGESLKELKSIVKSNVFSMNDHERMQAIDRIYTTLRENRSLVSYYTRKNISVSYVRAREKNNLASVKALYGNTASRYW